MSKKLEELLAAGDLVGADLTLVNQGGQSRRLSLSKLKEFVGSGAGSGAGSSVAAGLANVNDYLNPGDTNYNGAISRCLAANNHAYFPAKPTLADANNFYRTTTTINLAQGQSLHGDGPGVSKIVCGVGNVPVVTLGENIYWYRITGLTLAHGVTATAGGDGIFQGQGAAAWIDNCDVSDVLLVANYNGANLGKAFSGRWTNVLAVGNANDGFRMTTNGVSLVNGESKPGPLQTVFLACGARSNGHDGFAYYSTGNVPVGSSLGSLVDCETFANGHHGVSAIGQSNHPLHSIRVDGGFFGEDLGHGIYLDSYSSNHTLMPQFMEAAGGSNIYLTANNVAPVIRLGVCQSAYNDGIISIGATNVVIDGGLFVNNGRNPTVGVNSAGIRIDGGSAMISNVRAYDTGSGLQDYGISAPGSGVFINGCHLDNNAVDPIVWATTVATSVASGCFPTSANTSSGASSSGDLTVSNLVVTGKAQVNSLGVGMAALSTAGTISATSHINLQTTGNISGVKDMGIVGDVTMTTGSLYLNGTGAGKGGLVAQSAALSGSLGVGAAAPSGTGQVLATQAINIGAPTGGYKTGGMNVETGVYVNNVALGAGGGSSGGDLTVSSLTVTGAARVNSLGVGMAALSTAGTISATGTVNLQTTGDISGARNVGIVGDVTMTTGSLYLNGTGAGQGGLVANNVTVNKSIGVGLAASGSTGLVSCSAVIASAAINTGAITMTGSLNLSTTGDITGARNVGINGDVTVTTGSLYLNGTSPGQGVFVCRAAKIANSLGVGVDPSGTSGRLDVSTIEASSYVSTGTLSASTGYVSSLSGVSSLSVAGAISSGSLSTGSVSASSVAVTSGGVSISGGSLNLNSAGNISGVVNMGIVGDVTMTQGMLYLNGTGAGKGGLVAQSVALSGSLGVGTAAASTVGRIDATNGVYDNGARLS